MTQWLANFLTEWLKGQEADNPFARALGMWAQANNPQAATPTLPEALGSNATTAWGSLTGAPPAVPPAMGLPPVGAYTPPPRGSAPPADFAERWAAEDKRKQLALMQAKRAAAGRGAQQYE